jgi:hypothetical protein
VCWSKKIIRQLITAGNWYLYPINEIYGKSKMRVNMKELQENTLQNFARVAGYEAGRAFLKCEYIMTVEAQKGSFGKSKKDDGLIGKPRVK